jgi:hypothetical protein
MPNPGTILATTFLSSDNQWFLDLKFWLQQKVETSFRLQQGNLNNPPIL